MDNTPHQYELTNSSHAKSVREMFTKISRRYDLTNRIMSAGQDLRWRKAAIQAARLKPGDKLLDVAAGTGDMVFMAKLLIPDLNIVAVDFTIPMIKVGKQRNELKDRHANNGRNNSPNPDRTMLDWAGADTYTLPFPDETFDAVTSAFLLRNLSDPLAGLVEQTRVLKPGGRLVMLDATPPPDNWLHPFIQFHLEHIIPTLGKRITGSADAYRYFPKSVENFLRPQAIAGLFSQAGLHQITCRSFMFGASAVVSGVKRTDLSESTGGVDER